MCRTAFDLGITHFDLANNYGPPPGSAEENFGQILGSDFHGLRDELIISTKAGYNMWPGPYGEWGSRKYLLASLDQSLKRMGLDYVDIFYSHRVDPETPLEETMGALDTAVRQGKALYVGISSYSSSRTAEAAKILRELGTPCVIHQPSYSMLNRWVESDGLLDRLKKEGIGMIAFSPLAQGMLSDQLPERHAAGEPRHAGQEPEPRVPEQRSNQAHRRAQRGREEARSVAGADGVAWVLRDERVTSALIGASRPEQISEIVGAMNNPSFSNKELVEIDRHAEDTGINLWQQSSIA